MGHPRAVKSLICLALLVGPYLRERGFVRRLIVAARYERRHPAQRVRAPAVAGVHQQVRRRGEEMCSHRHLRPVGENHVGTVVENLDHAENVVPPPQVQSRRPFPELVEDLLHLEGGENVLDQHRWADAAVRDVQPFLRVVEHVIPQPRFQVRLELGQVVVRPGAVALLRDPVVVDGEAEIEKTARDGLAVHQNVPFHEVQASGPHAECGGFIVQLVPPAVGGFVADRAPVCVPDVQLTVQRRQPRGGMRVLKVGHVDLRAAVQRIYHHAPVG